MSPDAESHTGRIPLHLGVDRLTQVPHLPHVCLCPIWLLGEPPISHLAWWLDNSAYPRQSVQGGGIVNEVSSSRME
jgi:hypothetical protein